MTEEVRSVISARAMLQRARAEKRALVLEQTGFSNKVAAYDRSIDALRTRIIEEEGLLQAVRWFYRKPDVTRPFFLEAKSGQADVRTQHLEAVLAHGQPNQWVSLPLSRVARLEYKNACTFLYFTSTREGIEFIQHRGLVVNTSPIRDDLKTHEEAVEGCKSLLKLFGEEV